MRCRNYPLTQEIMATSLISGIAHFSFIGQRKVCDTIGQFALSTSHRLLLDSGAVSGNCMGDLPLAKQISKKDNSHKNHSPDMLIL